jgi:hypothetical protein
MSHASLTVVFVPGTDFVGDVDGDDRARRIREQQDAKTVGQTVFCDAFHRCHSFNAGWKSDWLGLGLCPSEAREGESESEQESRRAKEVAELHEDGG